MNTVFGPVTFDAKGDVEGMTYEINVWHNGHLGSCRKDAAQSGRTQRQHNYLPNQNFLLYVFPCADQSPRPAGDRMRGKAGLRRFAPRFETGKVFLFEFAVTH